MAILFDGSANSDHYALGNTSHPQSSSFTFKIRVRFKSWTVDGTGNQNLIQNWYQATGGTDFWALISNGSGTLTSATYSGGSPTSAPTYGPLELNRTYEIVISYAANTANGAKVYIDGVLRMQGTTPAAIGYDDLYFGGGNGQATNAYWDSWSLWTVALTASEVLAEFGHDTAQKTANLWDTWNPTSYQAVTYAGSVNGWSFQNLSAGDTYVADDMVPTMLAYGAAGTLAYSTSGGATVSPTHPTGMTADSGLALLVAQKPATANGGGVTTPTGYTLQASLTGANDGNTGGYTTTLGADTGNVNLYLYTKDTVTGSESGTLAVSLTDNNVAWAQFIRIQPVSSVTFAYSGAAGKDTASGAVSIATGSLDVQAGDMLIGAMAIPTDVTTPSQFSAEALAQTSTVFTSLNEVSEPDTTTGNQIGGFVCYGYASSGGNTAAVTLSATAGGTTTNVKGPGVVLRIRGSVASTTGGPLIGTLVRGSLIGGALVR
jgi:hypothetical protein